MIQLTLDDGCYLVLMGPEFYVQMPCHVALYSRRNALRDAALGTKQRLQARKWGYQRAGLEKTLRIKPYA